MPTHIIADTESPRQGRQLTKAASNKEDKYRQLANSHIFVPVAIETAGTWNMEPCIIATRIKEAIHIRKEQDKSMNRDEGSYQLSHIYDNLFALNLSGERRLDRPFRRRLQSKLKRQH